MFQSAPLLSLALVDHSYRKPEKLPEGVDKFDKLIDQNTKIIKLLKKNISKVVIFDEFIIFNKVVTSKKIPSNIQKGQPIMQAYNDKDKNFMLMQLLTKLLYGVLKADNYCFAIYHPHYKEKLEMTESAYNSYLHYINELVDNPT